jgi:hypothetical protein
MNRPILGPYFVLGNQMDSCINSSSISINKAKKTKDCVFTLDLMDNLMIDQPLIDETIPQTDHSLYVFVYYLPICFLP